MSAEEQRGILGPSKWLAWKDGKFGFEQLSKKTWSAVWGKSVRQASLVELLGGAEAKKYQSLADWYRKQDWKEVGSRTAADMLPKVVKTDDTIMQAVVNFQIYDEIGKIVNGIIPSGSEILNVRIIAGANTSTQIKTIERLVDKYGGQKDLWEKRTGMVTGKSFVYEVHWYQYADNQYEIKTKRVTKK